MPANLSTIALQAYQFIDIDILVQFPYKMIEVDDILSLVNMSY